MHRRTALGLVGSTIAAALAAAAPGRAVAHHGWSSFDPNRPLYLRGRVKAVRWRNPHAEADLEPTPGLALPAGLATRELPAQVSQFDGKGLLARTQLVPRTDVTWTVELAPLTRMQAWSVGPLNGRRDDRDRRLHAHRSERTGAARRVAVPRRQGLRPALVTGLSDRRPGAAAQTATSRAGAR